MSRGLWLLLVVAVVAVAVVVLIARPWSGEEAAGETVEFRV